jgi:hypothetical protein
MKADMDQLTEKIKLFKDDPLEFIPKLEKLKPFTTDPQEAKPRLEELKSFKVDPNEANPTLEEFKTTTFGYPLIKLVLGGMLALLGVALLIGRQGKRLVPVPRGDILRLFCRVKFVLITRKHHAACGNPCQQQPSQCFFRFHIVIVLISANVLCP